MPVSKSSDAAPVGVEHGDAGDAALAGPVAILLGERVGAGVDVVRRRDVRPRRPGRRRGRRVAREEDAAVGVERRVRRAVEGDLARFEHETALAQALHGVAVVADEQQGRAVVEHALDALVAGELKARVADGQRFVEDEDLRLDRRRHGEGEAHVHAARVDLHRLIDELADVGEARDRVEARADLVLGEAEQRAVEIDVLAAAELGVEAGAELEQRRDAAAHLDAAGARRQRAGDELQQRALPLPLRPTMPRVPPRGISNDTSRSAQNSR